MLRKVTTTLALLSALGLAVSCSAQIVFVDTIGDGSNYQKGKELARTMQAGFDTHPMSGDFTGVRPIFNNTKDVATGRDGVMQYGTSGVPCAQLLRTNAQGTVYLQSGEFGAWIAQPFIPAQSGYITAIDLIAQDRHSVGYSNELPASQRKARVYISNSMVPSASDSYADIDISPATVGKQVSGTANIHVDAGQTYYAVIGVGTPGAWVSGNRFYFNLNWAWKSVVSDSSRVSDALYNNDNCNGSFVSMPGRVLGIKISGTTMVAQEKKIAEAKTLGNGEAVKCTDVVISAKSGAVGPAFYYVEDAKRCAGIRVVGTTSFNAGDHITLVGTMTTVGVERAITQQSVSAGTTTGAVIPLGMNTRALNGYGLSAVGLLVRVAGNVTAGSPNTIDDGSCTPISVIGTVTTGSGQIITGIASLDAAGKSVILVP